MRYVYKFCVWPEETFKHNPALYDLFILLNTDWLTKDFSEEEFREFRSGLSKAGFTLRQISRVPWQMPENVL
jgi:hypothetical protein